MKKLTGLSETEIKKIGRLIGEAYYAEDDPMIKCFEHNGLIRENFDFL